MKNLLLGTVALAALSAGVTANAAEIAVPRRAAYVAPLMYTNWTGCHIGGDVGTMWGNDAGYSTNGATTLNLNLTPFTVLNLLPGQAFSNAFSMTGFTGGFYAGCDYQLGNWVLGVEGDWSNVNKEGQSFIPTPFFATTTGTFTFVTPASVPTTTYAFSAKERWLATARARLGYAVDKWLFFVTGGAAWTKIDTAWSFLPQTPIYTELQSDRRTGWTVGVGLEYGVGYGWSVRSEYLYVQFPGYNTLSNPVINASSTGAWVLYNVNNGRITNNIMRFGLTYKFGSYAYAAPVTK